MTGQPATIEPENVPAPGLYPQIDIDREEQQEKEAEPVRRPSNPTDSMTNTRQEPRVEANGGKNDGRFGKYFSDEEGNLKLVNWIVRCPCCTCCTVIGICLFMCILLGVVLSGGGLPITDDQHAYDVFDVRSKDYDAYRLAKEITDDARAEAEKTGEVMLRQEDTIDIIYWIYEAETDGGMFTSKGLDDIKAAESIMLDHPKWHDYCVLDYVDDTTGKELTFDEITCVKPLSPLTIFFPEVFNATLVQQVVTALGDAPVLARYIDTAPCIEGIFSPVNGTESAAKTACDLVLASVSTEEQALMESIKVKIDEITKHWTGKGQKVSDPELMQLFCAYLKQIPTRAPLVDFHFDAEFSVANPKSMYTRSVLRFGGPREGFDNIVDNEDEQGKEVKEFVLDELYDDMKKVASRGNSKETNTFYFMTQLIFDIFIQILIRDTISAVVSVLLVFYYLWYMLGSLFLASTGMLEILLSIPCAWFLFRGIFQIKYFAGLNMLTIFIVAAIGADDIFVFMDAYKQSAHAGPEVNRNLQTRLSWVWRKAGLAMAITSATTCCAFLCTCISPLAGTRSFGIFAALVILWDYILVMSLFCTSVVIYHNRFEREPACAIPYCCGCCTQGCSCDNQKPTPTEMNLSSFHDGIEIGMDKITKFFRTTFTDFILSLKGRIVILAVVLIWLIPAIIYVAKLEPTKTAEQFLNEDHPLQYSITIINEKFPQSSENPGLRTYFAWGIGKLDQGGVNQLLDDDFVGKVELKESFNLGPQCQRKLLEACDYLEGFNRAGRERIEKLVKRSDNGFFQAKCFLRSFNAAAKRDGHWDAENQVVQPVNITRTMADYFANPPRSLDGREVEYDLVLENVGFDGKDVKWVSLEVESSTLDQWSTLPEDTVREVYGGMQELADDLDEMVGDACGERGVLMTDLNQKFVFMNNQRIYRTSAISGAFIGVAIAFIVLCLATRSLLLSFLSTLSILCTIMSVIGVVTMIGWTLGTVEAILISILAGFSVDYVVHLAHAYATAYGEAHERLRSAFAEMGTPVLSGMITSVLASLPLFACQIVFFAKFGTFLCFTILFSWLFANFGFMALLATLGPAKPKDTDGEDQGRKEQTAGASFGSVEMTTVTNQME